MPTDAPTWEDTTDIPTWEDTTEDQPAPTPAAFQSDRASQFSPGRENPELGLYTPRVDPQFDPVSLQHARAPQGPLFARPGVLARSPADLGEVIETLAGQLLHPIKSTEAAIEQFTGAPKFSGPYAPPVQHISEILDIGPKIPKFGPQEGTVKQLGAGAANAVTSFLDIFLTPGGASTVGIGALPQAAKQAVLTEFAVKMATDAPKQLEEGVRLLQEGKVQEGTQQLLGGTGSAVLANLVASHVPTKGPPIRDLAPFTATELAQEQARVAGLPSQSPFAPGKPPFAPERPGFTEAPKAPETPARAAEPVPAPETAPAATGEAPAAIPEQPVKAAEAIPPVVEFVEKLKSEGMADSLPMGEAMRDRWERAVAVTPEGEIPVERLEKGVNSARITINGKTLTVHTEGYGPHDQIVHETVSVTFTKDGSLRMFATSGKAPNLLDFSVKTALDLFRQPVKPDFTIVKPELTTATSPIPEQPVKAAEAVPETLTTLYRAGDANEIGVKAWSSWSESKGTAETYLDNPGFGGATIRTERVPLKNVLDADTTNRKGMADLAEKLGFPREAGDQWFDNGWRYPWEESQKVRTALAQSGFDAIRYIDDFPSGATTIVPLKDYPPSKATASTPPPSTDPAISFPGIGSLREADATPMRLGQIRKTEPELWKAITQMFGTDKPAQISKMAKHRLAELARTRSESMGPGAAAGSEFELQPPNPESTAGRASIKESAKRVIGRLVDFFRAPPESKSPPPFKVDLDTPLPDLQPKAVANEVLSQPFSIERIPVIGRLFGGRARIRNEKDQAIAAWFGERNGIGPAIASAVGAEIQGKVNSVFKVSKDGDLNVWPTKEGQSLKAGDVFEELQRDPNAYVLTIPQRTALEYSIKPLLERHRELTKQYDLAELRDEYFPRMVTERPVESEARLGGGRRVGAKQSFQKERAFETEREGWEKGYKYETDLEKRLVSSVERLYRAIADQRLINDPVLEGKTRQGLMAELREAYAEELGAGTMTEAKLERIVDGLQQAGTVWQPGFFGKIFDAKTANLLNKEFAHEQSSVRRVFSDANDFVKALTLGFDLGVSQIQLLLMSIAYPRQWAIAQTKSIASLANPRVWRAYAERNIDAIRELAQHGSSVGRLPEMLTGLETGTIQKIPGLRQVAKPFTRQFHTALDVAKIELWKAYREVTPPEQWSSTIQTLESLLQSARMESVGVPHGRALLERVALLAPSYYRGAVNLIGAMGERGVSGQIARRAMGSYIIGGVALFSGVAGLIGMRKDEIARRLNPMNPNFMLWEVNVNGKKVNIGPGGIFRSFLRLAGNTLKTSVEQPGNWGSLDPEKNPMTRWYRGHAGPVVSLSWDQFSGEDFMGRTVGLKDLPAKLGPLWMQDLILKQGGQRGTPTEAAAQFVGLQSFPSGGASADAARLAKSWLAKSDNRKAKEIFRRRQEDEYGESKYLTLRTALANNDMDAARAEVRKLMRERSVQQIKAAVRFDKPWVSKELDPLFIKSLASAERRILLRAQQERITAWRRLQRILP